MNVEVSSINLDGIPQGLRPAVGQLVQQLVDTLKPGGALRTLATSLAASRLLGGFGTRVTGAALGPVLKREARKHGAELTNAAVQLLVRKVLDAVNRE